MIIQKIRKSRFTKGFVVYFIFELITQFTNPASVFALTGGPSQPEVSGFTPIGTTEMVDVFSGDFNYNIPLLDVGGYPVNMSYASGVSMDQEASWVGLGWNLNVGAITRNMRTLPDEFDGSKGDIVQKEFNMRDNKTVGFSVGFSPEALGWDLPINISASMGVNYNNYNGISITKTISPTVSLGDGMKDGNTLNLGFGLSSGPDGLNVSPSVSFTDQTKKGAGKNVGGLALGLNIGASINSRQGLTSVNVGGSISQGSQRDTNKDKVMKDGLKKGYKNSSSQSVGSSVSFVNNTYVPSISMSRKNYSISAKFAMDISLFGLDGSFPISAFYSEDKLAQKTLSVPAFGYLAMENGAGKYAQQKVMLDFNREKEQAFTPNTPNLPLTNFTYDIFQVAGQGVGGQYRAYRNDIGAVHDSYNNTTSLSGNANVEIGTGNTVDVGVDVSVATATNEAGNWISGNNARNKMSFTSTSIDNPYESSYFKQVGEMDVDDDDAYMNNIGGFSPVEVEIIRNSKFYHTTGDNLVKNDGSKIPLNGVVSKHNNDRAKRNQLFSYLTKSEVASAGMEKYCSPHGKGHHLGEISIVRPDGSRYFYSIPAYNITQHDVTFNVPGDNADCHSGQVQYTPGVDNSMNNENGIDWFYQKDVLPSFAHSYLFTSVVSNDYVDIDDVTGPSEGDLGTYTKFNYDADKSAPGVQPKVGQYKWRVPLDANTANYNEGLKADLNDDKGSYSYGEKELWYLESIETKTHVAVFHTSERHDAKGVLGENGGMDVNASSYKLDRIDLYSREDYKKLENGSTNVKPIKSVHFEYDYSLCGNVDNNDGDPEMDGSTNLNTNKGKLTLTKVYFTYENSKMGELSPYEFSYDNLNPDYNLKGYDKWGCYKENPTGLSCSPFGPLSAAEFPYVEQDQTTANENTSAWTMSEINLPSGGKISIEYESDDYSYVQNVPVSEMQIISGVGSSEAYTNNNQLYLGSNESNYVYFDIPLGLTDDDEIRNLYSPKRANGSGYAQSNNLYFKFLTNLANGKYDYVPGYATISNNADEQLDIGYTGTPGKAYIQLDLVQTGGVNNISMNPFSFAGMSFLQTYLPRLAFDLPDPQQNGGLQNVVMAMANANLLGSIFEAFQGVYGNMRSENKAKSIVLDKSWIRTAHGESGRLGGGCRVKSVRIWDEWDHMTGGNNTESDADYGQEYFYTTEENGRTISSGVATFEPLVGGDENSLRQPITFNDTRTLGPKQENYLEAPFGESFYPSPSVGYSKVEMRNIARTGVENHATGTTVHEFYTAKDFPTKVTYTNLQPVRGKNSLGQIFGAGLRDFMTASQGYAVELNDMHGKPKSNYVYPENSNVPISYVEYKYETENLDVQLPTINGAPQTFNIEVLNNRVETINTDGTVEEKELGVEVDMISDFRRSQNYSSTAGVHVNLAAFFAGPIPIAIPAILPNFSSSEIEFKSAVTTKVINRFGILKETIAHDLGSTVSTKNLAYDSETGQVLLTETANEFEDAVYNFNFPAHWSYDRMGQAYQNIGMKLTLAIGANGDVSNPSGYLVPGDEILLSNNTVAYVYDNDLSDQTVYLIDYKGDLLPAGSLTGKIYRSGRRNQQQTMVGSVTTKKNPIVNNAGTKELVFNANSDIIAANAIEFSEEWGLLCNALLDLKNEGNCSLTQDAQDMLDKDFAAPTDCRFLYVDANGVQTQFSLGGTGVNNGFTYPAGLTPVLPLSSNSSTSVLNLTNGGQLIGQTCDLWICTDKEEGDGDGTNSGEEECLDPIGQITNPYYFGVRGNYRNLKSWTYLNQQNEGRKYAFNTVSGGSANQLNQTDQQNDGVFETFNSFWQYDASLNKWVQNDADWTWASEISEFSPYGLDLESRDALNRYSSQLLGYNNTYVKAVATNTEYNELAFDGFEDYDYEQTNECCPGHFNFIEQIDNVTEDESHTGRKSLKVLANQSVKVERELTAIGTTNAMDPVPFTPDAEDIIGVFGPDENATDNEKYVLSYWVKKDNPTNEAQFDYQNFSAQVTLNGSGLILPNAVTKSKVIDGWQRVEAIFEIPAGSSGLLDVSFVSTDNVVHYLDDVRIHPFNGYMKSYVYDPVSFRLWAELDERNFATLYEYDEEGKLLRIKKETERGVYTVQESNQGMSKE